MVTNRTTTAVPTCSAKNRKALHATWAVYRSPADLANVIVSACDGTIEPLRTLWEDVRLGHDNPAVSTRPHRVRNVRQ